MERGSTEQGHTYERIPAQSERGLGQAALRGAEAMKSANRTRNLGQKSLAAASKSIPPVLNINRFDTPALAAYYPPKEINADRAYVKHNQEIYKSKDEDGEDAAAKAQAKQFEMMFLYGVQRNAWLGNTLNVFGQPPFTTDTSATTEYDDYMHRIDAFTTLTFANAQSNEVQQASIVRAVMGFDATISGNRETIMRKLTCCNNDKSAQLPFGFSQIKYYVNGRTASKQLLVPRYVIGISGQRVQDLQEMAHFERQDGKITDIRFNYGQSAMTRFMVLSEIRSQNELYKAMLPDVLDTPLLKKADMSLSIITEQLNSALDQCVDRLSRIKWIMGDFKLTPQDAHTPEERKVLREYVQQRIMDHLRKEYDETREAKTRRRNGGYLPANFKLDPNFSDTYVQIMECTEKLTAAAKDGKLDKHRTVSTHNKPFTIPS